MAFRLRTIPTRLKFSRRPPRRLRPIRFWTGTFRRSSGRTGFPKTAIGPREVQIIQGTGAGGSRVKLFFDKESGLLVRVVRYTDTAVGVVPTQTDYSDYREVAGVKMPFHWTATWTDGQSTTELSAMQPNVAIDAAKFAKPAPAAQKPAGR